eukprot:XP_001708601.1 Hypothetical protein GL50803_98985 [Giardia lamblia ATCC 50803]
MTVRFTKIQLLNTNGKSRSEPGRGGQGAHTVSLLRVPEAPCGCGGARFRRVRTRRQQPRPLPRRLYPVHRHLGARRLRCRVRSSRATQRAPGCRFSQDGLTPARGHGS